MFPWENKEIRQRFLSKIQVCDHGKHCKVCCWEWIASTHEYGYGQFYVSGDSRQGTHTITLAHVFMYQLVYGEISNRIEDKIKVCHTCDNPPCCNYHHLFTGTQNDNIQDAVAKNRHFIIPPMFGESNPWHKLTSEDIEDIFRLKALGYRQIDIASIKGVSAAHISRIILGQSRTRG